MNVPAKRFSLQRLLTAPAPAVPPVAAAPPPPELASIPETAPVLAEPTPAASVPPPAPVAPRIAKAAGAEESHPKKKRSYSVDMKLCEDLEILSWYQSRSSSSVVEELIRKHLQHQRALLFKAREIHSAR
ncbi:MAG TPA: hypothetical protein VKW04_15915 [Planctomycetota bacterium]|nr:hypothetical protein [Planctomycetota bacterium]